MPRKTKTISQWIESQGEQCAGVRIQLGSRAAGTTVGIVEIDDRGLDLRDSTVPFSASPEDAARVIEDLALSAGWGSGLGMEPVLKLYSIDKKGKVITSMQRTAATPKKSELSDIAALSLEHRRSLDKCLDIIVQQSQTNIRTVDILTETLSHRESLMSHTLEAFLSASQDSLEQKAANMVLETALDQGEKADGLRTVQEQVLNGVMGLLGGSVEEPAQQADLTATQIFEAMKENPMLRFDVSKMFDNATTDDPSPEEPAP